MKTLTTILLTVAAALALAGVADAHRLSYATAAKAVKAEARKLVEETDARGFKISSCNRKGGHRWKCVVRLEYSEGASYCEVPITVFYKTHSSRRLKREVGETLCY